MKLNKKDIYYRPFDAEEMILLWRLREVVKELKIRLCFKCGEKFCSNDIIDDLFKEVLE